LLDGAEERGGKAMGNGKTLRDSRGKGSGEKGGTRGGSEAEKKKDVEKENLYDPA